jgi:acyl carrier protein
MTNLEKYNEVFTESFALKNEQLGESLEYNSISGWDSVGHMSLIVALEEKFEIQLEMDEIIDFSSYNKGIEILTSHGIEF